MIEELLPHAERIAAKLKARGDTISIAESSTAGLISAALLAIPGASAYFMGGGVVYTRQSRTALLEVTEQELTGITPSTEAYALLFARKIRGKLATTWSVGETGTAGPNATPALPPVRQLGTATKAGAREPDARQAVASVRSRQS